MDAKFLELPENKCEEIKKQYLKNYKDQFCDEFGLMFGMFDKEQCGILENIWLFLSLSALY